MQNNTVNTDNPLNLQGLRNSDEHLNEDARIGQAEQFHNNLALIAHLQRTALPDNAVSAECCDNCENEIPQERRLAIKGVRLCVFCKELEELEVKRYG